MSTCMGHRRQEMRKIDLTITNSCKNLLRQERPVAPTVQYSEYVMYGILTAICFTITTYRTYSLHTGILLCIVAYRIILCIEGVR